MNCKGIINWIGIDHLCYYQKRDERGPRKFYKIKAEYESLTNDSDGREKEKTNLRNI